jgi:uncharacterized RDD family membrane protein YckC
VSDETPGGPGAGAARDADAVPLPSGSARVFASTIDVVVAGVLLGLLDSLLFVLFVGSVKGGRLTSHQAAVSLLISLLTLLLGAVLWVLQERHGGSVGKRFAGLRTTTMDGVYPAPYPQLFMKYLLMFALLAIGYYGTLIVLGCLLVPFWQKQRRNAFDLLARLRAIPRGAVRTLDGQPTGPAPARDEPAGD